jgi:hypothetical protein
MRFAMRFAYLLLPLPLLALPTLTDCVTKSCTAMACYDGATLTVDFAPPAAPVHGLRFDLCRNDTCVTAGLGDGGGASAQPPTTASQTCGLSPGAENPILGYCTYQLGTDGRVVVQVTFDAPNDATHTTLEDGDVYRVVVTSDTGAVLADARSTAKYDQVHPNGADCDGAYYCQYTNMKASL